MGSRLPAQRSPAQAASGRMPRNWLGRWIAKARFSRWTLAARLTAIVLTLAVPLNFVIAVSVWRLVETENHAQRSNLQDMARSIAAAVDAELREYMVLGQALSRSPALRDDDLAAFEAEAGRTFASIPHAWIMVADPQGRELMNTAGRQPGSRREAPEMAAQKRAFETHSIAFGGVRSTPIRNERAVSIEIPVFKDGQPFRELAVSIETREFLHLFSDQRLPPNWLGGILDGEGHFVAGVPGHIRHSDRLAKDWREANDPDGSIEVISAEGEQIVLAHAHSALSGWPVGIAVKNAELAAAAWSATQWVAIPGAVLSALSLLFAGAIGFGIPGPIVTEQVKARRTLIEKESLRRLGDSLPDSMVYRYERDASGAPRFDYVSAGIEKLHGLRADDALRDASILTNQMLPQYRQLLAGAEERSAREMSDLEIEFEIRRPDGEVRWIRIKSRPKKTPDGRVMWEGIATDITARKLAEEKLRESEERLRLSNEAAGIGTFTIDMQTRLASYSPELSAILGVPGIQTASVEAALARVHRDDAAFVRSEFDAAALGADSGRVKMDFRFVRPGGEIRWMTWLGRVFFREGPSGRLPFRMVGACLDITERKRSEEHIQALMREVNHRSKNILSLAQAIARQTLVTKPDDFIDRFGERLESLAANHDLLVKNEWKGVRLDDLVRSQLAHFKDLLGTRIIVKGAPLLVSASAAQALGMALHELATNAGKYGTLSNNAGCVEVSWSLDEAETSFEMRWNESGGPPVDEPKGAGFGSTVIGPMLERSLDAHAELHYAPGGVVWRMRCPIESVLKENAPAFQFR